MAHTVVPLVPAGGRVAVVGAGSAGLAAARAMRDAGYAATVFECGGEVGGTWNYEHKTSAMYRSLRCNIPKECMEFRDFAFPDYGGSSYLTHRQVHRYLIDYSIHFALRPLIRFHSTVVGIAPKNDKQWHVQVVSASGAHTKHHVFDAVCIANGHFTRAKSYIPPGTVAFCRDGRRTVSHSRTYRVPDPYFGRRVVVVGNSASGTDIALELERTGAAEVFISHNLGKRGGKFAGTIQEVATIKSLASDGTVTLTDGKKIAKVDDILLCTGYVYDLSFLDRSSGLSVGPEGRCIDGLVSHCISLKKPTLSMIGVPHNVVPFPMFEDQALFHASILRGVVTRSQLEKLHALEVEEQKQLGYPRKYLHKLMGRQWEIRRRMANLGRFPAPSLARIEIYNDSRAARRLDVRNFRETSYKLFGEGSGEWTILDDEPDSGKYAMGEYINSAPMQS